MYGGVGGGDGGGGVSEAGRAGGMGKGGVGVGCVSMGRMKEGGREREERRQLTAWNLRTHTSNPFFSGLARHFHRIRKSFDTFPLAQTQSRLLQCASEPHISSVFPSHVSLGGCRVPRNEDKTEAVLPCCFGEHHGNGSQHSVQLHN